MSTCNTPGQDDCKTRTNTPLITHSFDKDSRQRKRARARKEMANRVFDQFATVSFRGNFHFPDNMPRRVRRKITLRGAKNLMRGGA